MYNLIISIVAGVVSFVAFSFLVGRGDFRPLYGLVPGIFVLGGAYFVLARRTMARVEAIMNRAQESLTHAQTKNPRGTTPKQLEKAVSEAVKILKEGYQYEKWQFWIRQQIDGQIGQLLYMAKKYDTAEKYLKNAFQRHWLARAMLGTLYYKRKRYEEMEQVFEEASDVNKKEALFWNVYAYCLWKSGQTEKAIAVLNRALEHMEQDEKTKDNLHALQNNKKMKMRGWNMMWYQFHLDQPPQPKQMQFRRR